MTTIDVIYHLILKDRSITSEQIEHKLTQLDLPVPTRFLISERRAQFLRILKLLENAGMVEPGLSVELPDEERAKFPEKKSKTKIQRSNYRHWAAGKDD